MKRIKLFENFKQSEEEIRKICDKFRISNWTLNSEGLVDVDGDVKLNNRKLTKIPIQFGEVTGHFFCSHNDLISLEGCPEIVNGLFSCSDNNLTSLEGAPKSVGGSFYCEYNNLTSLEGAPLIVNLDFHCNDNNLTSLEGGPEIVGNNFYCNDNKLKDLYGFPLEVRRGINLKRNTYIDPILDILKDSNMSLSDSINLLNDYAVWVRGELKIRKVRFNALLSEMGIEPVHSIPDWTLV